MEEKTAKNFKILSIDGGGIKGLYSLYLLKQFEEKYCDKGTTLSDYFDMICGTSTGGIIALGIAAGLTTDEIIKIYDDNAKDIFPGPMSNDYVTRTLSWLWKKVWSFTGYQYDNKALCKVADKYFGDKKLFESKNLLCVPCYDLYNGRNTVFKFPHSKEFVRDGNILMKDVAMSTSAAPTYFPLHHFTSSDKKMTGFFVDGGIWANNPALIGITEALRFFVGNDKEYSKYEVLSIGNIENNQKVIPHSANYFWNVTNMPYLIDTFFDSNTQAVHHYCRTITACTNGFYKRIVCNDPTYRDTNSIALDNSSPKFLEYMQSVGTRDAINMITKGNEKYDSDIERFFKTKKSYQTNQHCCDSVIN